MKKALFLLVMLPFFSENIHTQPCVDKLPDEWNFKTEDDFGKYEADILACIEWLSDSPMDTNVVSRRKAMKFIFDWGKESPTLLIFPYTKVSNSIFQDLKDNNKSKRYGMELFMSYYCGMIKYLIENKHNSDLREVQFAGVSNVIKLYMLNSEKITDSRAVFKFLELQENNELKVWIDKKVTNKEIKTHNCFQTKGCEKGDYTKQCYPELAF